MEKVLEEFWGFKEFRGLQKNIIESVMTNQATMALLPTGGGKSICFQVPGLVLEGICLVISPLIALMKDQVEGLNAKGIAAEYIYAGMHKNEIDAILDNCIYGEVKFLYCSPERLKTEIFIERIKKIKIGLIAIDEAHCVSQWGEDFRPAYLNIKEFIIDQKLNCRIIALTASATKQVQSDITEKLGLISVKIFKQSFKRENLVYAVRKSEDKEKKIIEIFERVDGSGIIYVRNRRKTKEFSDLLNTKGIKATGYHGGMTLKERNKNQESWMLNESRVMVATNAFGMGIDKADVRIVVHADLSECFEDYYQEAGRAGRDGKKSIATIVYNEQDIKESISNYELNNPKIESIKIVYQSLANYYKLAIGSGELETFEFIMSDFAQKYQLKIKNVYAALKEIEKMGLILMSEAVHSQSKIRIEYDNRDLYKFQIENAKYDKLLKLILRQTGGSVFSSYIKFDEYILAQSYLVPINEVRIMLKGLTELGVIAYQPASNEPKITFLKPRSDVKDLDRFKTNLEESQRRKANKLKAMLEYVGQNKTCRQKTILNYFDEIVENDCGICDVCIEKRKKGQEIGQQKEGFDKILLSEIAKNSQITVKKLVKKFDWKKEKEVLAILQELVEIGKVVYDDMGRLTII